MQKTCLDIAYDMKKLNKLKEYLVNKGYINNDFDTNILFARLTDGVKSVKLIEFDIDINYLMGKILNYVSLSIDNALIDDSVPFEEYKNFLKYVGGINIIGFSIKFAIIPLLCIYLFSFAYCLAFNVLCTFIYNRCDTIYKK